MKIVAIEEQGNLVSNPSNFFTVESPGRYEVIGCRGRKRYRVSFTIGKAPMTLRMESGGKITEVYKVGRWIAHERGMNDGNS